MSDWNGPAQRGAMRIHRENKRREALERAQKRDTPPAPVVVVAPPIELRATGDVAG